MDVKLLFEQCLVQTTEVMAQVKTSQFSGPTPDTEWDVRTLIAHMLYELSWVADTLAGKTVAEVGQKYDGDLIDTDLQKNWRVAADNALDAVAQVDITRTIHLSYGDFPAEHYIREQANDQLIHAWDLGSAIGVSVRFDPVVAEELYQAALPRKDELAASGLFAPAVSVPETADIQTKLLALLGRRVP